MTSRLNLSLTDELKRFIDSRAGEDKLYATSNEYLCDLVRRDMESQSTVGHMIKGLEDIKHGRFSEYSILDIADEELA